MKCSRRRKPDHLRVAGRPCQLPDGGRRRLLASGRPRGGQRHSQVSRRLLAGLPDGCGSGATQENPLPLALAHRQRENVKVKGQTKTTFVLLG